MRIRGVALVCVLGLVLSACRPGSNAAGNDGAKHPPATARSALPPPALAPTVAPAPELPPISAQGRIEDERNTIAIFRKAAPATVFVSQHRVVFDPQSMRALEVPAGTGSGFIWDNQGHVVTNYHVVRGGRRLQVRLLDQKSYPAKIIGVEPRKDIAVLRIIAPPQSLTPLELPPAGQDDLVVGQKAIAIGNPFGLDHTLTTGVISAIDRQVDGVGGVTIRDMIQTDAAINPGNSGGPLLDSAGRLIGMNTMIFSKSGASAGIGFAVPVTTIRRVVPQLIKHGKVVQVGLGIGIDRRQRLERRYRITGVIVLTVPKGSPAERAGIRGVSETAAGLELGDVIVGIGGDTIKNYDDLYNALESKSPGLEVDVRLLRGRTVVTVKVRLETLD